MGSQNERNERIQQLLNSEYVPVGIKIIQDSGSHWNGSFQEVQSGKRFCYYVRQAAKGEKFVMKDDFILDCHTPYLCLGFKEPKYADIEPRIKPANTKAVLIAPLGELDPPVDSVVFIVNAKQAMLITGALRRILKKNIEASFGSTMAVCGEVVAHTIVNKTPNLSVLCQGARIFSDYTDNELVIGIPYELFDAFFVSLQKVEELQKIEAQLKNNEVK